MLIFVVKLIVERTGVAQAEAEKIFQVGKAEAHSTVLLRKNELPKFLADVATSTISQQLIV